MSPTISRSSSEHRRLGGKLRTHGVGRYPRSGVCAGLHPANAGENARMQGLVLSRIRTLRRSPLGVRVMRFAVSSMFAAATSAVVFALLYVMGASTTVCSITAFVAGAIPNWTINRRWTWKVEGGRRLRTRDRRLHRRLGLDARAAVAGHGLDPPPRPEHPRRARDPGAPRDRLVLRRARASSTGCASSCTSSGSSPARAGSAPRCAPAVRCGSRRAPTARRSVGAPGFRDRQAQPRQRA